MAPSVQDLAQLYGITAEDVTNKVTTFKGWTGETDDTKILPYLRKADMDIARAVDLFFELGRKELVSSGSPSPKPAPASSKAKVSAPPSRSLSRAASESSVGNPFDKSFTTTTSNTPTPSKPAFEKKRRTQKVKKKPDLDLTEFDDSDSAMGSPPKPTGRRNPSRKSRSSVKDEPSDESEEELLSPPKKKKKKRARKSSGNSPANVAKKKKKPNEAAFLPNDEEESSEGEDDKLVFKKPDMDDEEMEDADDSDEKEAPHVFEDAEDDDLKDEDISLDWERKILGAVEVEFVKKTKGGANYFYNCDKLAEALKQKDVKLKDTNDEGFVDEILKGHADKRLDIWLHRTSPHSKKPKADETVKIKFFVYIIKGQNTSCQARFDELMLRFGTEAHQTVITEARGLPQKFKDRKLKMNTDGILDFSQHFETTDAEEKEFDDPRYGNGDQRHGLKKDITLHKYQHQSINWLIKEERSRLGVARHFFHRCQFPDGQPFWYSTHFGTISFEKPARANGGLLCEEMGLGKTIEMIALQHTNPCTNVKKPYLQGGEKRVPSRGTLVVCPTSLGGQWFTEIKNRTRRKGVSTYCFYGNKRERDPVKVADHDWVITTYSILTSRLEKEKCPLQKIDWWRIILDESHYIMDGTTRRTKYVRMLQGRNKWGLTGTPMSGSSAGLPAMKDQMQFVGLGPPMHQKKWWVAQQKSFVAGKHKEIIAAMQLMKKCVMRHKKDQDFNGEKIVRLPNKKEEDIAIKLTATQQQVYNKLFQIARLQFDAYKRAGRLTTDYLKVTSLMLPLRKAASGGEFSVVDIDAKLKEVKSGSGLPAPAPARSNASSAAKAGVGKMKHAVAEEEAFNADEEECPICLELIEEPLQTPCRHIFCGDCIRNLLQSAQNDEKCPICRKKCKAKQLKIPPQMKKDEEKKVLAPKKKKPAKGGSISRIVFDTKLKHLIRALEKIKREKPKEKALVFTTYASTLNYLKEELPRRGFNFRTLTGDMDMNKRRKALEQFQQDPPTTIFLLSIRAGAVGITLTAASHVFMLEPCLNLGLYRQAVNRVYRLGQKKNVHVRTLYVKGSIEESILALNKDKSETDYSAGSIQNEAKKNAPRLKTDEFEILFKDRNSSS